MATWQKVVGLDQREEERDVADTVDCGPKCKVQEGNMQKNKFLVS